MGNFLATYIEDIFHGGTLQGFANGSMNQDFVDKVKSMEGIDKVLPLYVMDNTVQGNGVTLSRLEAADNLSLFNSMFAIKYDNKAMENHAKAAFENSRAIILSADFMDKNSFSIGDTITLTAGDKVSEYKVAGRIKSRANSSDAVIPAKYFKSDFGTYNYGSLAYTAADPESIMIQIRYLFGNTSNWSWTIEEFKKDASGTIGAFLSPMRKMTYFILLLSAVGIINNLLINYIQKRRSIAMYKSIGLSNMQNIRMTLIEGFSSGLIGAAIGIPVSYMELQTIIIVTRPKVSMTPELDIGTFLITGVIGIAITLIGSLVPILKSRKMNLVEEIKFE
jgi:ABC-type antimicrobial peptide transport system permease subunit